MTNKKELNNEELEQVSGGMSRLAEFRVEYRYKLDKYETENYINQELFFVTFTKVGDTAICEWLTGYLLNSYEKPDGRGTIRTANVLVTESYSEAYSGTVELSLDKWTAYKR